MPPDRWDRLEAIFHDALERRAEERDAFVEAASGGDRGLAEEVRRMLAADADAEGLVAPSPGALARKIATSAVLEVGERLGAWRVVRPIASGGMGSVFLAERDDRRFEQRVAIKVIRRELVAEGTTERFRRERRLLARLRHPNVARLLDGGETDDGRPYLVMEHVDGEPIDAYCDGRRLAIERRIELFRDVCAAVDEAHRNLVVHRDLKPSNILVTADGTPKLLDFGIAKLLEEPDDLEPDLTRTGNRPMTPGYASPEQVRAEPTTTATDVYSLGVVLYELLTGQRPYGPTVTGGYELERAICETTPTRPSDAVAAPSVGSPERPPDAAGRLRSSRPEALRRRLAGDLDNIVLRAMQKDPTRRYPSAGALGDDLRRHLLDLPVAARPDSVAYRARKFVKRNRLAAAMIGVAATAVIGGTAGAVRWAVVAERERERAAEAAEGERLQSDRFRAVNAFLGDLLSAASPAGLGTDVPVGAVLDRAAARIDDELDDPSVEMDVRLTIGRTYSAIGRHADAALHFEAALALARRHLPADDPALVPVLDLLAGERIDTGAYDEAAALLEEARARIGERDHPSRPSVTSRLGHVHALRHDLDEATRLQREAVAIARRSSIAPLDHARVLGALAATLSLARSDLAEGEALLREAIELIRVHEPGNPSVDLYRATLARNLLTQGRVLEVRALLEEIVPAIRRHGGPDHPDLGPALVSLARAWMSPPDPDLARAEALHREALELHLRVFGREHPDTAAHLANVALALRLRGDFATAEELTVEAIERRRRAFGDEDDMLAALLNNLGGIQAETGAIDAARGSLGEALGIKERAGREDAETGSILHGLGFVAWRSDDPAEARAWFERALAARERVLGAGRTRTESTRYWAARAAAKAGDDPAAIAHLREHARHRDSLPSSADAAARRLLGACLARNGEHEEAESILLAVLRDARASGGDDSPAVRRTARALVELYESWDRPERAAELRALAGASDD